MISSINTDCNAILVLIQLCLLLLVMLTAIITAKHVVYVFFCLSFLKPFLVCNTNPLVPGILSINSPAEIQKIILIDFLEITTQRR